MYKKKTLTLSFALILPLSLPLWAEESEEPVQPQTLEAASPAIPEDSSVTAEAEDQTPAVEARTASEQTDTGYPPEPGAGAFDSMKDHWKAREEQYQALRKRAQEAGVMLPERPPWESDHREALRQHIEERMAHQREMMSATQEERDNYRQQRYQEMRARAEARGMDMPETPPWVARQQMLDDEWAKHQKVIEGMSDEERAACQAMQRRHMDMMRGGPMGPGCAMGQQGCGMYRNNVAPGGAPGYAPGYGYGPAPAPYGPGDFWDPNQ